MREPRDRPTFVPEVRPAHFVLVSELTPNGSSEIEPQAHTWPKPPFVQGICALLGWRYLGERTESPVLTEIGAAELGKTLTTTSDSLALSVHNRFLYQPIKKIEWVYPTDDLSEHDFLAGPLHQISLFVM